MLKSIRIRAQVLAAAGMSSIAFAAVQTATLAVPCMNCSSCPITVKRPLMEVDGMQQVKTSFEQREAVATFDNSKISAEKLNAASTSAGYAATVKAAN